MLSMLSTRTSLDSSELAPLSPLLLLTSPSLPLAKVTSSDVTRIINSDEIQSVLREKGQAVAKRKSADALACPADLYQAPSPRRRTPSETRPSSSDSTPTPRLFVVRNSSDRSAS